MTFLYPLGLIGLLSLPVILALHFLRKRQRRYVVSNLALWAFLDPQMHGPRSRRIPLTWLLLLDLLIAALFSLAWAQPRLTLPLATPSARQQIILVDVSSSMRAKEGASDRLAQAKSEAYALLDSAGPNDVITLLSFGRQAKLLADSREDAGISEAIRTLQAGETGSAFAEALAMGLAAVDPSLPVEFHVITDGSYPEESLGAVNPFAYPLEWHFVGGPVDNQAVVELNAVPYGENQQQIFARIANFGSLPVTRRALLEVDGRPIDQASIDLPAGASVTRLWQVDAGSADVTVTLQGQDGLVEDDFAAIGLQPGGTTRVALVAENPSEIQQALEAIPGAVLEIIAPAEYAASDQANFDLTIFRSFLPETWPTGRILIVDPPTGDNGQRSAAAPETRALYSMSLSEVSPSAAIQVSRANALTEGIDFNGVRWSSAYTLNQSLPGFVPLLRVGDIPLLLEGELSQPSRQRNPATILLADLSQGNFTQHPAFPILIANLVDSARQAVLSASIQTGEPIPLPVTGGYQSIQVSPPGQPPVELSSNPPEAWDQTLEPGLYRFRFTSAEGEINEAASGAIAGDEVESDLRPREWTQTAAVENNPSSAELADEDEQRQINLRDWLLGATILLLIIEAILAWRS